MKTFTKKSMISLIIVLTMILNLVPFGALTVYAKVEVKAIFEDNFENYANDTTISSGKTPYTVRYNGSGDGNQKIITSTQKDGSTGKVLQLQGESGWASEIKYEFTPDDKQYLVFETDIKPVSGSSPGGIMICSSKAGGSWTHSVCRAGLADGGFFNGKNDKTSKVETDFTYSNGNWYHIKLILDKTDHLYYIFMDNTLIGNLGYNADSAKPEYIILCAGNAGTNTMYFDNVKLYSTNTFEVHQHKLTLVSAKDATCSSTGKNAYYICSDCKKVFTDTLGTVETTVEAQTIAINPNAHDWDSGIVTTPATCTADGIKTYTCNHNHEHTKTEPVDKIEHALEHVKELAATCTADGNDEYYKCSACDKYFTDALGTLEIADKSSVVRTATNHDWGEWTVTTPATEDSVGEESRICKNDSTHTETREIPKLTHTHTLVKTDEVPATCLATGTEEYWSCSGCHKMFSDSDGTNEIDAPVKIAKTAHAWNDGEITTPATCTTTGVKIYTCTVCRETKTETIAKKSHTLETIVTVEHTCETDGIKAHYKCSECNKLFADALGTVEMTSEDIIDSATGHDWGEWLETTPATVDNEGVKTRICKNDSSHKETATIDRLPYAILEGNSQTFVIDSSKDITIRANGTFDKFLGLKMDGKDIESKFYTAVSGSTVVTLAQEYMDTLDEGEHTLTFVYTDGTVDSTLKIAKVSTPEEINNNQTNTETTNTSSSPKTGDNIIIWISLLVVSTLGIMSTIRFIKKKS